HDRAAELFEESLPRLRALDDTWAIALALNWLGKLVLDRGDTERAGALQRESLALFRTLDDVWGIAACLAQLAYVASSAGNAARAVRLLGAAEALRGTTGTRPPRAERAAHERAVADLCAALGEEAFTTAWSEGRAMTPQQAIVYAVSNSVSRRLGAWESNGRVHPCGEGRDPPPSIGSSETRWFKGMSEA